MTVIERRVCLEPQYLNSNIINNIFDKINNYLCDECTKEDGYIIKINSIIQIKDNCISSSNSDIILNILLDVDTLKPEIGSLLEGKVCMIFYNGIFLDIQNKMKFLIPLNFLKGFTFNKENLCYIKDNYIIKKGDILRVQVVDIKYKGREFMCFGNLIE